MKKNYSKCSATFYLISGLLLCLGIGIAQVAPKKNAKILVGPNILVSRDGEIPHAELMVAYNPKDPRNLLGTAITFTHPDGRTACKTYASSDGGYIWRDSSFPEQMDMIKFREGGFDPQVAFGLSGTAYFCALANYRGDDSNFHSALHFYRSEDGGITWGKMIYLNEDSDHEMMVVDQTNGRYAGRVYVGFAHGSPQGISAGILRSEDDGKSFIGPVDFAHGGKNSPYLVANILVLSDGTLFVPFREYSESEGPSTSDVLWYFVTSEDGGVTLSSPSRFQTQKLPNIDRLRREHREGGFARVGIPMFAVDSQSRDFKDRLYMVWTDARFGKPRLMFSYSKDKGKSWTEPKNLDPDVPEWSSQYQPMIYVNPEGILGLMWFDTRGSDKNDRYQLYFTASLDGGESFLPSVIVSSAPSFPAAEINLVPSPLFGIHRGKSINVRTLSAFTRWADGGDYMGLTATPDGLFRPFWVDSHGRSFQVWTCQIDVKIEKESKPPNAAVASQEAVSKKQEKVLMNDKLELAFDPMRYDSSTRIAIIPVRLKNISKGSLRGPFLVRIKSLFPEGAAQEQLNIPEILDASNGKKGAGAEYDYSASLRDFEYLEPGGLTEAIEWTFKFTNPQFSRFISDLDLEVEIIGSAAQ